MRWDPTPVHDPTRFRFSGQTLFLCPESHCLVFLIASEGHTPRAWSHDAICVAGAEELNIQKDTPAFQEPLARPSQLPCQAKGNQGATEGF